MTDKEAKVFTDFIKANRSNNDTNYIIKTFFDDLFRGEQLIPYTPIFITLCIVNTCNLNCIHCSNSKAYIEWKKFDKIILILKKWRVRSVYLTGREPTLHNVFIYFVKKIKNAFHLGVLTNGQQSYYNKIDALTPLLDENYFVQFRIDEAEEKYSKIRINGDYQTLMKSISYSVKNGLNIKTNTAVQSKNIDRLSIIYTKIRQAGIRNIRFVPMFNIEDTKTNYPKDLEIIKEFSKVLITDNDFRLIAGLPISLFYPFII